MTIVRADSTKEKMLTSQFKEDTLSLTSMAPGNYKDINDVLNNFEYDFMSHEHLKKDLEEKFGKSKNFIDGKSQRAKLYAFEFNKETLLCTIEGGIGTKWYWVDSAAVGSRYGKPYLLPHHKEIVSFWPDFCVTLKNILNNKQ